MRGQRIARFGEFLRVDRGARQRQRAFDMAGRFLDQGFDPFSRSRAASPKRRSEKTCAKSGCGCASHALWTMRAALRSSPPSASMRPASAAAGAKVGASFAASSADALARVAIGLLGGKRARGEHHRALAAIAFVVERALVALKQRQRAGPVAGDAELFQHRLAGPAERGIFARRFLGESMRAVAIAAALRFDEQAVQPERLGVGAARPWRGKHLRPPRGRR